jgi:low affinity Fe/Cu permease
MSNVGQIFSRFATAVSDFVGRPQTFVLALCLVLVWAITGPFFGFSDVWQLVINTSTTIITFLMIFVLQNSQNRDGKALQAKLDELILTSKAQNKFIGIEKLDEKELKRFHEMIEEEAAERAEERGEKPEEHDDERQARQAPFQTVTKQAS